MESWLTQIFEAGEEERWMDLTWEIGFSEGGVCECGNWGRGSLELLRVLSQDAQWERDDQVSQGSAGWR